MDRYIAILDSVLEEIDSTVTSHPPERGGALLGPKGQPMVTRFLLDQTALVTGVEFNASRELESQVSAIESGGEFEFKGLLHSHPRGIPRPSSQDLVAFADSLRNAPWLGRFIAPIVTDDRTLAGEHHIRTHAGTISFFVAEARRNGKCAVETAVPHVVPLSGDAQALAQELGGSFAGVRAVAVDGQYLPVARVGCSGLEVHVVAGPLYPTVAPLSYVVPVEPDASHPLLSWAVGSHPISTVTWLPLTWSLDEPEERRLVGAVLGRDTSTASVETSHGFDDSPTGQSPRPDQSHGGDASSEDRAQSEATPDPSVDLIPALTRPDGSTTPSQIAEDAAFLQSSYDSIDADAGPTGSSGLTHTDTGRRERGRFDPRRFWPPR